MKAIITGASGFIGRKLHAELTNHGIECLTIPHSDLLKIRKLEIEIEEFNPNVIYHFAAYGNMSHHSGDSNILKANILGTFNLLEATKDIKYDLFVNCSTSSVYGHKYEPMKEWGRLSPDTMYAATKAGAEYLCRAHRKQYTKKIVTVRPFSVYGEGEADYRFIPTLIKNHKQGIKSTVVEGMHDWIHVDDFVSGVMAITNNKNELCHRTYNIGTGVETSNIAIAEMITDDFDYIPKHKIQDSPTWVADTTRLESLNWRPKISLEEGIERCIKYYG